MLYSPDKPNYFFFFIQLFVQHPKLVGIICLFFGFDPPKSQHLTYTLKAAACWHWIVWAYKKFLFLQIIQCSYLYSNPFHLFANQCTYSWTYTLVSKNLRCINIYTYSCLRLPTLDFKSYVTLHLMALYETVHWSKISTLFSYICKLTSLLYN